MTRKPGKTIARSRQQLADAIRLRDRAVRCRRLAAGAGDPEFALKLAAIADEYQAKAVQAEVKVRAKT